MRLLWSMLVAGMAVAASASEAGDAPLPGLHVRLRKPVVNRGGTIRARVAWETGIGNFIHGDFEARWQLRSTDGTVVARGRRTVRIGLRDAAPSSFPIAVRAPRDRDWNTGSLEVALLDAPSAWGEGDLWAEGEATVSVYPGGIAWQGGRTRESRTGILLVEPYGTWLLNPDRILWGDAILLAGPGESSIRANPAWRGARVTVTGRFYKAHDDYFPGGPGTFWVETVGWLDPLPERLPWGLSSEDAIPARLPPPEILGEVNWARFARESREPVIVETPGEMAALHAALGTADSGTGDPLEAFDGVDFTTHRVVVVFAGVCPDPAWMVRFDSAHFDPAGTRTLVRYSVFAPADGFTRGFHWSEPYAALAVPRRDGPVEFRRREWIPEPPPWW